jgi:hypothetical protein
MLWPLGQLLEQSAPALLPIRFLAIIPGLVSTPEHGPGDLVSFCRNHAVPVPRPL